VVAIARRRRGVSILATSLLAAGALVAAPDASAAGCGPTAGVPGGEWRSYGRDLANTRFQEHEKVISAADVPFLAPAWVFSTQTAGGEGDITGTPVIADGCVYVATNRGWVFAMNADTGELVWKALVPDGGGINSSVTADGGRIYAAVSKASRGGPGGGGPYVVALDQYTGALLWKSPPVDTQVGSDVYGSPVAFAGNVLLGVSGGSAELGDEADRYAFQGNFNFIDAATGALRTKLWVIHPPNQPNDDFAGAGIWSTPAVDPVAKVAFVGAGNPFQPQAEHAHTNAVLRIDVDPASPTFATVTGSYKGNVDEYVPGLSKLPCYDFPGNTAPSYPQGLGSCGDIDMDFGASSNLFRAADGRLLVGTGQKSGVYHVFDAATMKREWTALVGPPTPVGGIVGSTAVDGDRIYGPVTVPGYLWSTARTGGLRWVAPVADALHWGEPVAVANGVVYTVDLKGFLDAYEARTGLPLLHRPMALGGTGSSPALSWGGVSVARNTVYAAVGITSFTNGFVVAFRPNAGGVGGGGSGIDLPNVGGPAVVAGPGAFATGYATPLATTSKGGRLSFTSLDLPQHDVVAVDDGPDGQPLFKSRLIGLGETAPVEGLDRVEPGRRYEFYCSIHPNMRGTLIVTNG
jgi:polyvinyl alcohol dehydrogenase (cytochrome)